MLSEEIINLRGLISSYLLSSQCYSDFAGSYDSIFTLQSIEMNKALLTLYIF